MTATIIPKPADRAEWLRARLPFFNASDAGTLVATHPFKTLAEVVRQKLAGDLDAGDNSAMRRGRHLEAGIAEWFEEECGLLLEEPAVMFQRGPFLATVDRVAVGTRTLVEIKTTSAVISRPEPYWLAQVAVQLYCTGYEAARIVAMDATLRLHVFEVERDEELIARLVERATSVMEAVAEGRWPECVTPDPPARHSDRVLELDEAGRDAFGEWAALHAELHDLGQLEEAARKRLTAILGDAQAATIDGQQCCTYRSHERRNVDLTRLRAEHAEVAEALTVVSTVRVLRATK